MNQRDKAIVSDIQRFRVLSRDLIASLHFQNVKNPITAANTVLKRLHRDKYIERSTERRQYVYFPAEGHIKKTSAKLGHFLEIASLYVELCKVEKPKSFVVEPRYGVGMMEPDVFCIWKGGAFFIEIQCTQYSAKMMNEKIQRYDHYYLSEKWKSEPWQPTDRRIFPTLWITGKTGYNIGMRSYKIIQASTEEMFAIVNKQRQK